MRAAACLDGVSSLLPRRREGSCGSPGHQALAQLFAIARSCLRALLLMSSFCQRKHSRRFASRLLSSVLQTLATLFCKLAAATFEASGAL